jgi:LPXTG-motif cell wall-anchored protein
MSLADGMSGGGVLIWAGLAILVVLAVLYRKMFRKK